jgi:hypothetical protein
MGRISNSTSPTNFMSCVWGEDRHKPIKYDPLFCSWSISLSRNKATKSTMLSRYPSLYMFLFRLGYSLTWRQRRKEVGQRWREGRGGEEVGDREKGRNVACSCCSVSPSAPTPWKKALPSTPRPRDMFISPDRKLNLLWLRTENS